LQAIAICAGPGLRRNQICPSTAPPSRGVVYPQMEGEAQRIAIAWFDPNAVGWWDLVCEVAAGPQGEVNESPQKMLAKWR